MTIGSIAKNGYRKILLDRGNNVSPTYSVPSKLVCSIDENTPNISTNTLSSVIPIKDGSVLDNGSTNLTGSGAGNNSTDNTTTFKQGAGESDDTAQNLIKDNTAVTAIWTGVIASPYGDDTQFTGHWLYIKDTTAYDKLVSSSCFVLKIGSDSSNYYSLSFDKADLAVGWNWITSEDVLGDWTEVGTVSGNIDYFSLTIETNNATDEFAAGDIIYDLLRQWESADTLDALILGYPAINETILQSDHAFLLTIGDANGFFITKLLVLNTDSTPLICFESLSDGDSKSRTDQWRVSFKNILR